MHQLDFTVTVWSDDEELLQALEQFLKLPGAGCLVAGDALTSYANCLGGKIEKIEVGGVDINWDDMSGNMDEEDPAEKAWRLAEEAKETQDPSKCRYCGWKDGEHAPNCLYELNELEEDEFWK